MGNITDYKDILIKVPKNIMEMEIILEPNKETGLRKKSLLRLDFIMTIPKEVVSRKIGKSC